jgi:DNA topoisomerase-1
MDCRMPRYSPADSSRAARMLALRYVTTTDPGYTRRRRGRGFAFFDTEDRLVDKLAQRAWLASLPIPPAWTGVWICRYRNGHILATGRDARSRKQYLYHPDWRAHRNQTNFHRLARFGRALRAIRARVDRDLRRRGLLRERVLAAAVRLMDATHLRVGSEAYARENRTFGLTTLLDRHLHLDGRRLELSFRAKGGQKREIALTDRRLARVLRQCEELPGQRLFQYLDDAGRRHAVDSQDINAYLRETAGEEFTAKDFRTWGGTVTALEYLMEQADREREDVEQGVRNALEYAAAHLGNTVAVTRQHYVHPRVLDAFRNGTLPPRPRRRRLRLSPAECVALKILTRR